MSATQVETYRPRTSAGGAARYDLTAEAEWQRLVARPFRYLLVIASSVFLAILTYKFTAGGILGSRAGQSEFYTGAAAFTEALASAMLYAAIWMFGPSVSTIDLGPDGRTLTHGNAKSTKLDWGSPRFRFRIE